MALAEVPFDLVEVKLAAPVDPAWHRDEGGCDRAAVRVELAFRDRGRACRLREDDVAGEVGRGRSASVRVGRARRTDDDARGVPAIRRGRDSRRRADAGRGVRRAVGPGWIELVEPRSAARARARHARETLGARARRPARRRQSVLSRRARGVARVRSPRLADRGREQGRSSACRSAAGGRMAWCTRSAWRTSGWTSERPRCCSKRPASRWTRERAHRADRADGRLARRAVPFGAFDAGGRAEPGERRGLHRRRRFVSEYFRFELLSRLPPVEAQFLSTRRCSTA